MENTQSKTNWMVENLGTVIGKGCGTPSMTAGTDYPKMAYELGLSI